LCAQQGHLDKENSEISKPPMGNRIALSIEPLEVEDWLKGLLLLREKPFANPTLDKTRRVMSLIYRHGQRYGQMQVAIPFGSVQHPDLICF
jgi:hypothetical protein